jgi:hypothetical protein
VKNSDILSENDGALRQLAILCVSGGTRFDTRLSKKRKYSGIAYTGAIEKSLKLWRNDISFDLQRT